jgi:ribonucleoside-diphosphate reductase alpha chain
MYLKDTIPELCEDDVTSATGGIVSLPQESPKGSYLRENTSALDLLQRAVKFNQNWVAPGHRSGDNMHNVSVTISVRDDEWERLGEAMWKYRNSYTGISLLPFDGGTYKQAPFEACSKEKFEEMSKYVKSIDLRNVIEKEDKTERIEQLSCVGGVCEIS